MDICIWFVVAIREGARRLCGLSSVGMVGWLMYLVCTTAEAPAVGSCFLSASNTTFMELAFGEERSSEWDDPGKYGVSVMTVGWRSHSMVGRDEWRPAFSPLPAAAALGETSR